MARRKAGYEELLRIIDLCRVVGRRGADPFEVNIRGGLLTLKQHLPRWRLLDELLLDAEALNALSDIVRLQSEWIRHRASSMYIDPLLVEVKVRVAGPEELATALLKSWRPIVHLSQLSPARLKEAMDYWNRLLPFSERFEEEAGQPVTPRGIGLQDLVELRMLSEEEFEEKLHNLWRELRERAGDGRIEYHEFVYGDSFPETVMRAYLTSFLTSQGYALLEVNPLEEEIHLSWRAGREGLKREAPKSIAVPITYEAWSRAKGRARGGGGG